MTDRSGADPAQEVEIASLGNRGEGVAVVAGRRLYVPGALPGERVRVRRTGADRATAEDWISRSPDRVVPPCRHFGRCGGCALQHLADGAYAKWKTDLLAGALARRQVACAGVLPLVRTPPRSRRRAEFAAVRSGDGALIGFHEAGGAPIVDLAECLILDPRLERSLPAFRDLAAAVLPRGFRSDVTATLGDGGIDLMLSLPDHPGLEGLDRLVRRAEAADFARLSWRLGERIEIAIERRPCRATFGGVAVDLPPGAFMQASVEGERAIVADVLAGVGEARELVDLYSGCGTLTFALAAAPRRRMTAIDGNAAMVSALDHAARRTGLAGRVRSQVRDLARRPFPAAELANFDAVVFDPPYAGAQAQAAELARSGVRTIVCVSCNPATFARDARILIDGGYRLESVRPIDQFLWSPHLEVVGVFRR